MATNKEVLAKGVKTLFASLPLLFLGPIVLNSAFKNQEHSWYLIVVFIGCAICITAVFLMFKGLKTIINSMFDGDK
jgi:hypothetical protein